MRRRHDAPLNLRGFASRSRHGENGLLDLGHGVIADYLQIDVRKVWDLVRHHDDIQNGRAVRSEGSADRGLELTRLPGGKSLFAAGPPLHREVRIDKLDALPERRETD